MKSSKDFSDKRKKVSLNLFEGHLQVLDELATLTKTNRETMIDAVLSTGILSYLNYIEKTWARILKDKKYKENEVIHREIKNLLNGLKKIKSKYKWLDSNLVIKDVSSRKDLNDKTKKGLLRTLSDFGIVPKK
ncbi:MAG: hypothetical protein KKB29_00860 [Nanoarchaeota archaeon]|nr:hypothetical protein [Nanoarchaeota archaeon]